MVIHISVALQQKTANFNVAVASRPMQWSKRAKFNVARGCIASRPFRPMPWSVLTAEKQKNQLSA
jgi:hypothetical protein